MLKYVINDILCNKNNKHDYKYKYKYKLFLLLFARNNFHELQILSESFDKSFIRRKMYPVNHLKRLYINTFILEKI